MKKAILLSIVFMIFNSCRSIDAKEDLNIRTMELEYLEKLYQLRHDIGYKTKIQKIYSMIDGQITRLDSIDKDWRKNGSN